MGASTSAPVTESEKAAAYDAIMAKVPELIAAGAVDEAKAKEILGAPPNAAADTSSETSSQQRQPKRRGSEATRSNRDSMARLLFFALERSSGAAPLEDLLACAQTSKVLAANADWRALVLPYMQNRRRRPSRPRPPSFPLARPRLPWSPRAAQALCRAAPLNDDQAAAFRQLVSLGLAKTDFVAITYGQDFAEWRRKIREVTRPLNANFHVWGHRELRPARANDSNEDLFVAIAFGRDNHSVGLRSNGTCVAWSLGDDEYDTLVDAPTEAINDFVAIACGDSHSVGLRSNGTCVAWGGNWSHQRNDAPTDAYDDFVAIACGMHHSVGLRLNGTCVTWGSNEYGERNDAPTEAIDDFVAISCGEFHSVGLRSNGACVMWGDNHGGQRNDAPTEADDNFVAIACGTYHSVGLRSNGTVVTWGSDQDGQRNDAPTEIINDFVAIACGDDHSVGLRSNGTCVTWGSNRSGQRDDAPTEAICDFVAIACGESHSVGLRSNGTCVRWPLRGMVAAAETGSDAPALPNDLLGSLTAAWLQLNPNY